MTTDNKELQYMHEINRIEGERDYWRSMHAKTDSECVRLRDAGTLGGIVESFPWLNDNQE